MAKLYGLIPAAGKGTRAYPYTHQTPKGMLPINGVPNIERNIAILRDSLKITDIVIVTGYFGEEIRRYFEDGRRQGVSLTYVHNEHIDKGLAYSVLLGKEYIDDYFCVLLSDECYVDSNHRDLLSSPYREAFATCGVFSIRDTELTRRNYAVETEGPRITRIVEKPETITNDLLGSGTFLFNPRIFDYLEDAFVRSESGAVDLVTLLGEIVQQGEVFRHFPLGGRYTNINDRDSYQLAKYYVRDSIIDRAVKHLLIYSEGDEPDIAYAIGEYRRDPSLDRISVILPQENSIEEAVQASGVEIIRCPSAVTLYGEKIKFAMEKAEGDILILTEANYSFQQRDLEKLYSYIREADMVIGTRTTRQLIEQGSSMRGIVRASNVFLAKLMELLWWKLESRFTDVGCTFRAIWRSSYDIVSDRLTAPGPEFSAEMIVALLEARNRVIEIPVHYYTRSHSMYVKYQNASTFFRMLRLILWRRLTRIRRGKIAPLRKNSRSTR